MCMIDAGLAALILRCPLMATRIRFGVIVNRTATSGSSVWSRVVSRRVFNAVFRPLMNSDRETLSAVVSRPAQLLVLLSISRNSNDSGGSVDESPPDSAVRDSRHSTTTFRYGLKNVADAGNSDSQIIEFLSMVQPSQDHSRGRNGFSQLLRARSASVRDADSVVTSG